MTPFRAVYLVGGAGSGKSTLCQVLLHELGGELGPHEDVYTVLNSIGRPEILRGHRVGEAGFYLGRMRESFPGTDGLSRSTVIAGEAWLRDPDAWHPEWLLGEGATFATKGFLATLGDTTDLLLVHLTVGPAELERRFAERGSDQDRRFVQATVTRSANTAERMTQCGARVLTVDTEDSTALDLATDLCLLHLRS